MKNLLTATALVAVALLAGCGKDDPSPVANTNVITTQTISMSDVTLSNASGIAVLAGSAVTNTGATNITGDLGLSPGTSVGGFPPGRLKGMLRINDAIATQAKLDLTAAYNDAAGRTSTDIVTLSGNIGGLTLTPGILEQPMMLLL